jgi:hypothetical protein
MGGHASTGAGRVVDGSPRQNEGQLVRVDPAGEEGRCVHLLNHTHPSPRDPGYHPNGYGKLLNCNAPIRINVAGERANWKKLI